MAVPPLSGGVPPPQVSAGGPGCGTVRLIFHTIGLYQLITRSVDPGRSEKHQATRYPVSGRIRKYH